MMSPRHGINAHQAEWAAGARCPGDTARQRARRQARMTQ
jgi:hypothetical protein